MRVSSLDGRAEARGRWIFTASVAGLVIVGVVCVALTYAGSTPGSPPTDVIETVRDYDMRSMTVTEPSSQPQPKIPRRVDEIRHVTKKLDQSKPIEREFVCGQSMPLEQGGGSVRRCEWMPKKR